jgi:hypothetical protein
METRTDQHHPAEGSGRWCGSDNIIHAVGVRVFSSSAPEAAQAGWGTDLGTYRGDARLSTFRRRYLK